MKKFIVTLASFLVVSYSCFARAEQPETVPVCLDHGMALPIDNQQVLTWKTTTKNQFLARAHVQGLITQIYPDHSGHKHFGIKIGPEAKDLLEIIYSLTFGAMPNLKPGMSVEACGDYITSTEQTGAYPPSPNGAILHWVHKNPSAKGHESGYVDINGVVYGN